MCARSGEKKVPPPFTLGGRSGRIIYAGEVRGRHSPRFQRVTGDWSGPGVDQVLRLRERFEEYQGRGCESNRMPGELMGPPTLITLPHAKGMKLKLEESEMMLLKRRVRRRTKKCSLALRPGHCLTQTLIVSQRWVGNAASEGTNERQQWPLLPERHE